MAMSPILLIPVRDFPLPAIWLDASYSSSLTIEDTDRVTAWTSRVGGHSFASTGANRPTYVASGIGSKPSLLFDITEERVLVCSSKLLSASTGTQFIVADFADVTTTQIVFGQSNNTQDNRYSYVARRSSTDPAYRLITISANTTASIIYSGTSQLSAATSYVLRHTKSAATTSTMTINGAAAAGGTTDPGTQWYGDIVGANCCSLGCSKRLAGNTGFHGGRVAEIMVYDRALSERVADKVERYLATKYGITLS